MTVRRNIRRCALQTLYQLDALDDPSFDVILESLADSPGDDASHQSGFDLGMMAWEFRDDADHAVADIAPDWPTNRQPIIDRSILRLAYYEMTHTDTPPKVIINEAVELAREFSTEKSHLFINGVLDKLYRASSTGNDDAAKSSATRNPQID